MDNNYYLWISFDPELNNKVLSFGLYDKKTKRYYNGFNRVGQNYDSNFKLDWILDPAINKKTISIDKENFIKFKDLEFKKEILHKNLEEVLGNIGLLEHAI